MTQNSPQKSKAAERLVIQYAQNGFILFPLRGTGDDPKAPAVDNWRDTQYDANITHDKLGKAYGVCLQPEDFVIDVDPKRFENPDDDQLARLWEELNLGATNTLITQSAHGGYHVYFKKPPEIKLKSDKQLKSLGYGALEFKSVGRYVAGAGSRIYDRETQEWYEYTAKRGSPLHIQDAPEALLAFAERDVTPVREDGVVSDSLATRQRFVKYCMAVEPAIAHAGGNTHTLTVAAKGKDYGLPEERTYEIMCEYFNHRCQPEWDLDKLRSIVANAYAYTENAIGCDHPAADFASAPKYVKDAVKQVSESNAYRFDTIRKPDGSLKYENTIGNVFGFFQLDELIGMPGSPNPLANLVRFNMFSQETEFTRPAPWHQRGEDRRTWTDDDTIHLKLMLNMVSHFNPSTEILTEGVRVVAQKNRIHPVKDYLFNLTWDGVPRLDKWLSTYLGCEDSGYTQEVGKNTLMAACARILHPGCKHDSVLVLEGDQGTGKSTAIEILGGPWYLDPHLDLANMKDATTVLEGGWIVEISEMDFARKSDFVTLRAFITRKTDKIRPAYARAHKHYPRYCVFIGTFNPEPYTGYLVDPTGNRRFWPVTTGSINLNLLRQDRDQLFAEALQRVIAGEPYHIVNAELIEAAKKEQLARMSEDSFQETIERWLATKQKKAGIFYGFGTDLVAVEALGCVGAQITNSIRARICRVLQSLGYRQTREYDPVLKIRKRVWIEDSIFTEI